ncbi:MAG: glycosyltransferase [Gammaproteobacteria bacterium]|nr:glycosyltransferase [Gammaproteobacteria bacterium]
MREAGFAILDFRPRISALGDLEAAWRVSAPVNLVWVPCFRQRDVAAARRWSERRGLPLIFDALISAYDKQVFEREKFSPESGRAARLLAWERRLFGRVDLLLADTQAHAEFFIKTHGVLESRVRVVPLCADEDLFKPAEKPRGSGQPLEILFFGSFIPLQGPQVIVEAANLYRGPPARWCMVGDGPLRAECRRGARPGAGIEFEDWLPYESLPPRIARADIVLGIFGDTLKAARVVPNKVCQALACARPLVTRWSPAFPSGLSAAEATGITWVPPADPQALSEAVAALAASPQSLEARGRQAVESYRRWFSAERTAAALAAALKIALPAKAST